MVKVEHWPFDASEIKKNKKGQQTYTFEDIPVTIRQTFAPKLDGSKMQYATGWAFAEDNTPNGQYTGVIWSHPGKWDNDARGFSEPYAGPVGNRGQSAKVTLQLVEADERNYYNLQSISLLDATAPVDMTNGSNGSYPDKEVAAPPDGLPAAYDRHGNPMRDANGQPTSGYWIHRDEQITLGMAFNNLTTILAAEKNCSVLDLKVPDDNESIAATGVFSLWWKWFDEASRGFPLTPVQDEPEPEVLADAQELDAQAEAHLGEQDSYDGPELPDMPEPEDVESEAWH